MIDEERGFLDAIRAEPEDDGPRLVYADWLTQRGDPRGEQIVIGCELDRGTDRREELERRHRTIAPKLPDLAFDYELPVDTIIIGELQLWDRGFVPARDVFCHVEEFAKMKDLLYRYAPCAQRLRMYNFGSNPPWDAVLADPDVTRWGAIRGIPTERLASAAQHAHLDSLRGIEIQAGEEMAEDESDTEGARLFPLFDAGRFPALESLRIDGLAIDGMAPFLSSIDPDRWRTAAFAPTLRAFEGEMVDDLNVFPKLESFSAYYYGAEWLRGIIEFSGALKSLDLGPFDDEAMAMDSLATLFRAPCVKMLETLSLTLDTQTSHSSTAWHLLDRIPLTTLDLRGDWVDDNLVRALPALPKLRELRISRRYRQLARDPFARMFATHGWPHLEVLDLGAGPCELPLLVDILERLPALRRLRCGVERPNDILELAAIDKLEVLELHSPNRPALPPRDFANLHVMQLKFPYRDQGFSREHAERWGYLRGFTLLPNYMMLRNRGDDALTFTRWPLRLR